ncbi:hypothetical protein KY285_019907 [Solanum tuberosum]|nr:hypothetical protein KY285_019907 [Solanum tuberosum]
MTDAGYSGDIFTWTNGGRLSKRILIKLVRVMYFDKWSRSFQMVKVRYLPRTDSSPGNLTVADCLDGDHWDMDYISRLLPNNICQIIQSVNIGPRNWKDQAIWTSAHQEILLRKNQGCLICLNWIDFNDTRDSILEVDSMMVVKWLEGAYIVPWDLEHEVEHMKRIIEKRHIKVQHCFREANTVDDALAKFGNKSPDNLIANMFVSLQELPHEARGPIRMDKAQLANFRIKHK